MATTLLTRNAKSATQLVQSERSIIDFVKNPNTGKVFFTCGTIEAGYCSPAVAEAVDTVTLEELKFAECKKPELPDVDPETGRSNWVPCLMMVGNSRKNVVRSLGAELV